MFYHASQIRDLSLLTPHISNHQKPLVYLSSKRENVLVYLSNAIEKHCKEIDFIHNKPYTKWASYGFKDNILLLEEYYPNALIETYKGVSGYIYSAENVNNIKKQSDIPFAYTTTENVLIDKIEFIEDAYEEILKAYKNGEILINRYNELSEKRYAWIEKTIKSQYLESKDSIDYQLFLKAKFPKILENL